MLKVKAMGAPFAALVVVACGAPKQAEDPHALIAEAEPPKAAAPSPNLTLTRTELRGAIEAGLGQLLARAEIEPELREGSFVGFRLRGFDDEAALQVLGLRVGDVLIRVNEQPIATPDQAQRAFSSLAEAPSVVLEIEREGQRQQLTTPIAP